MDDTQYENALKRAILNGLGITEPKYLLKVITSQGSVTVELRDHDAAPEDLGGGIPIWVSHLFEGLNDGEIPATAKIVVDEFRPKLEAHNEKKKAG